jgi:hypothetical protein
MCDSDHWMMGVVVEDQENRKESEILEEFQGG